MRIDILARRWGGPDGGPDGMAVACAYLAWTLAELGHQVSGYSTAAPPDWSHPRIAWRTGAPVDFAADLVITAISGTWRRTAAAARLAGACERLVYWHHHATPPEGLGCVLAAPPAVVPSSGWSRTIVLPPSSWAAEGWSGAPLGGEVLVPGVGRAKGGHVSLVVAGLCPDLRFYALPGRSGDADRAPWAALPNAELAPAQVAPAAFLARTRAVLSPTRAEVHPLTLLEAAVRGIPIVCSDLPGTRAAAGDSAIYVAPQAPSEEWALALRDGLSRPGPRLLLQPYAEVVSEALCAIREIREIPISRAVG